MPKDFFKRWGKGIQAITPFQQARITYWNTYLIVLGITVGIYFTAQSKTWWLFLILLGAFVNTILQQIGNYQKYKMLKQFEAIIK